MQSVDATRIFAAWLCDRRPDATRTLLGQTGTPEQRAQLLKLRRTTKLDLDSDSEQVVLWLHVNEFGKYVPYMGTYTGRDLLLMSASDEEQLSGRLAGQRKFEMFACIEECREKLGITSKKFSTIPISIV
jgi:hypothetical protein